MILKSLSVIFSFQPISLPPLPADSPKKVVCLDKEKKGLVSHFQLCEDIFVQLECLEEAIEILQLFLLLLCPDAKFHLTLLIWPKSCLITKVFWLWGNHNLSPNFYKRSVTQSRLMSWYHSRNHKVILFFIWSWRIQLAHLMFFCGALLQVD